MTDIIVIGSGVSGLSSALQSQQAGFKVSIITRDRPQHTTSMAAGALWSGGEAPIFSPAVHKSSHQRRLAQTQLRH